MVVLFAPQRKANDDDIEKGRIIELRAAITKVAADVELQFIFPRQHCLVRQQRFLCPTICIGNRCRLELALAIQ